MLATAPLIPFVRPPPERAPSLLAFLRAVRTDAIGMFPRAAYERPTYEKTYLGRRFLLLNAPDAIHHVFVANAANYAREPTAVRVLRPVVGDGLLLAEGDAWRHQRRTVAPALGPRVLPILCRHVAHEADGMVGRLASAARAGKDVDLLSAVQSLALEVAARSMFSVDLGARGPLMRGLLLEFATVHARAGLLDMLLPASVLTPGDVGRRRFQRRWMAAIDQVIANRLTEPEPEPDAARDLFDLLRAARDPETGAAFDHAQLRDQSATMLSAGMEATAVTLFWTLYLLAQASAHQDRVAEEAARADLSPDAASSALLELTATRAVVDETMRLYPPSYTLFRAAREDDVADGVPIARGLTVMVSPWVLHRHRALWERPDEFDPSRWAAQPPRFAFMPFGAGPRVCVGARFALAEAVLVVARVVRDFSITLADPGARPVLPAAAVTARPNHAPAFRLAPRA